MLMQSFWLERRRKNLTIHLPGAAIEPLRGMLKAAMFFEELLAFASEGDRAKIRGGNAQRLFFA